jgi:pimeloyl-ACP methyl ester carboxylesterase
MTATPASPAVPEVAHHRALVNGTTLHYVAAGTAGSPILLVHGFPETWRAFRELIPLLAAQHRVFAVDLRGFGDSDTAPGDYTSTTAAEDLHQLIGHLGAGPVHLTGQDISGATVFRLAATRPEDVLSLTAIEMGLAGFGLEVLADITHGGAWYIGVLAAPGIPEMLLAGREREFLGSLFRSLTATPDAVTDADIDEFARSYARPGGWGGAAGLYRSMLQEGPEIRALAGFPGLTAPVLAVGAGGGPRTANGVCSGVCPQVKRVLTTRSGGWCSGLLPGGRAAFHRFQRGSFSAMVSQRAVRRYSGLQTCRGEPPSCRPTGRDLLTRRVPGPAEGRSPCSAALLQGGSAPDALRHGLKGVGQAVRADDATTADRLRRFDLPRSRACHRRDGKEQLGFRLLAGAARHPAQGARSGSYRQHRMPPAGPRRRQRRQRGEPRAGA